MGRSSSSAVARPFARWLVACAIALAVAPHWSQAQDAQSIDQRRLASLYAMLQRAPTSTALQAQVKAERARIRGLIDDQLNAFVNRALDTSADAAPYERERSLVAVLESKVDEAKVDQDLLRENAAAGASSSAGVPATTAGTPEYLAKSAVLEERIASTEFFLNQHRERLAKLARQQRLEQFSTLITAAQYLLLLAAVVFLERLGRTTFFRGIKNRNRRYAAMKAFTTGIYLLLVVWLIVRFSIEYPGFVTSFAIVGAGIAVALQDVLKDVVGWAVILQKRLFALGHRVSIGKLTGDVIDIGLLRTTLMEVATRAEDDVHRTGKTLLVPNSYILREPVLNYNATSDFVETQLQFHVVAESNWRRAEEILLEILREETDAFSQKAQRQQASRTYHFLFTHESKGPRVFLDVGDRGVVFTLRFLVPIGERRATSSRITAKILERFAAENPRIELAFGFIRQNPEPTQPIIA